MTTDFDSTASTKEHIGVVYQYLLDFAAEMIRRGEVHDASKLLPPEKEAFDRETPLLKSLTFGSDDYKASLARLGSALQHHYAHNSHHPEYYDNGIDDMDLFDLVEMFCDWRAAAQRGANKTVNLEVCRQRFDISPQLMSIFQNTLDRLAKSATAEAS